MCSDEDGAEYCQSDDNTPLGDALSDLAVDVDIDPVDAVRERRERERR